MCKLSHGQASWTGIRQWCPDETVVFKQFAPHEILVHHIPMLFRISRKPVKGGLPPYIQCFAYRTDGAVLGFSFFIWIKVSVHGNIVRIATKEENEVEMQKTCKKRSPSTDGDVLKDLIFAFVNYVLDLPDGQSEFISQRFVTDSVKQSAFEDLPVSFGKDPLVYEVADLTA